jgi:hypothetical protein
MPLTPKRGSMRSQKYGVNAEDASPFIPPTDRDQFPRLKPPAARQWRRQLIAKLPRFARCYAVGWVLEWWFATKGHAPCDNAFIQKETGIAINKVQAALQMIEKAALIKRVMLDGKRVIVPVVPTPVTGVTPRPHHGDPRHGGPSKRLKNNARKLPGAAYAEVQSGFVPSARDFLPGDTGIAARREGTKATEVALDPAWPPARQEAVELAPGRSLGAAKVAPPEKEVATRKEARGEPVDRRELVLADIRKAGPLTRSQLKALRPTWTKDELGNALRSLKRSKHVTYDEATGLHALGASKPLGRQGQHGKQLTSSAEVLAVARRLGGVFTPRELAVAMPGAVPLSSIEYYVSALTAHGSFRRVGHARYRVVAREAKAS